MNTLPNQPSAIRHHETRLLYLFTRTPLHVGAGASVGAIDQPIQRERHTGFPIIPGSTLKGVFADEWTEAVDATKPDPDHPGKTITVREARPKSDRDWLFGKGDDKDNKEKGFAAGALQFGEARLLAFPVRSARGSFAWITSPLMLSRAVRDGVLALTKPELTSLKLGLNDDTALFTSTGPLAVAGQEVALEEYVFKLARAQDGTDADKDADAALDKVGSELKQLMTEDLVWSEVATRLVIVSDGMMSFFATTACEVAQHVRIDDATGTADSGGLFNQENLPSESLLYALIRAFPESGKQLKDADQKPRSPRSAADAVEKFWPNPNPKEPAALRVFQFGADASTGLGYCTAKLDSPKP